MKRLIVIGTIACAALAAAACGSDSTGPVKDTFAGRWVGTVQGTATIILVATQTGNAFSGIDTVIESGVDTVTGTFQGTSTPPSVNATNIQIGNQNGYTYDGSYQSATSVTGWLHLGNDSAQVVLAKQ
jgi:hypothetical protein